MRQEVLGRLVNLHIAESNSFVNFALTPLPLLGPEPFLIGGYGKAGMKFDNSVSALDHAYLCSRLIELVSSSYVNGQGDNTAPLDAEVPFGRCGAHGRSIAVLLLSARDFICNVGPTTTGALIPGAVPPPASSG